RERFPNLVEIGEEVLDAPLVERSRGSIACGRRPEPTGQPHLAVRELTHLDEGPHVHAGTAAARATLHEIAGDRLVADGAQRSVEMVQLESAHRGVREVGGDVAVL